MRKHNIHIQFWLAEAARNEMIILKSIIEMYVVNAYTQLANKFQDPSARLPKRTSHVVTSLINKYA